MFTNYNNNNNNYRNIKYLYITMITNDYFYNLKS